LEELKRLENLVEKTRKEFISMHIKYGLKKATIRELDESQNRYIYVREELRRYRLR